MRRLAVIVAVVGIVAGGGGCGSDQDPTIDVPTTTSPPTTAPESGTAGTATTLAGATTPVSVAPTGEKAYLTALRAAAHPGYERVAFEFREPVPGYQVRYVNRPITEDGSGDEVTIAGGAVLEVRIEPASTFDTEAGDGGRATYTGPARFDPDTAVIAEIVRTGDFEAVLTWVVGVDRQRPFRVSVSSSPKPVLIIDITTT